MVSSFYTKVRFFFLTLQIENDVPVKNRGWESIDNGLVD